MNKVKFFTNYSDHNELERAINSLGRSYEILSVSFSTEFIGYSNYYSAAVVYKE